MRRRRLFLALSALAMTLLFAAVAFARVGGGESYSGGGSSGGGGGGGGGELIYLVFRLLLWLTIEHPVIGVPVDIVVVYVVVARIRKSAAATPASAPQLLTLTTVSSAARQPVTALRR